MYPGVSGGAMILFPRIRRACLSTIMFSTCTPFPITTSAGDHAVLYNSARFDDTASSDDGILDGSLDQASVGDTTEEVYLAAVKIFCRAGVVGACIYRPVFVKQVHCVLQIDQSHICLVISS